VKGFSDYIVERTPVGIHTIDREYRVKLWNARLENYTGLAGKDVINKNLFEVMPSLAEGGWKKQYKKVMETGISIVANYTHVRPAGPHNGGVLYQLIKISPLKQDGQVLGILTILEDLTELRHAELARKESGQRLRLVIQNMPVMMAAFSQQGRIVAWNRECERVTGYSADKIVDNARAMEILYHREADRRRMLMECAKYGEDYRDWEMEITSRNSEVKTVLWSNISRKFPIPGWASWGIGMDITARKRMEEELHKAGKLESLGILAGGIAHDFNNILTAVVGNISLAKTRIESQSIAWKRLHEAEKASLRAKDLTRQLLTFVAGGAPIKKAASIKEILRDSASFALRGANVRCRFQIAEDLWPVEVDEGQMVQVINNLIINATQAMPEGGTVDVCAENITLTSSLPPLEKGAYVRIDIADQGTGISPEHLSKIFDPFFTTKAQGSGLGLATTYSIINKHEGHIVVESKPEQGTTFNIYLPASIQSVPIKSREIPPPVRGSGRILLMDDDRHILDVTQEELEHLGYEVHIATDGAEAISLYKEAKKSNSRFDAIILDLTIPGGMGGKETIHRLLQIDPDVNAIVASGYSNNPVMANYNLHGFHGIITKPYRIQELSEVLHQIL